jgi:hypothetical protein
VRHQNRRFVYAAILFAGLSSASALVTVAPVLTNATWSGDQFQFTLLGETNVSYILESSSNLRSWSPSITNSDSQATRTIVVPGASAQAFWRVRPVPSPSFEHAILARGSVSLGGSGWIDSFDSADILYSTLGSYDPAKRKAGGHIASGLGTPAAVNVGNMQVAGTGSTGPGGTITLFANGGVGSLAWLSNPANAGLVEPGYHRDIAGVLIPNATLPTNFGPVLPLPQNIMYPPAIGGTNYSYAVLGDGDYRHIGNMTLGSGQKMLIAARCRIHVTGQTTVASSGYILMTTNASVEFYCSGRVDIQGQGVINHAGYAQNLSIISLTAQPVTYGGQARFIGTIYAPLSTVTLTGTTDAIGAIVCTSFNLSGSMGIHFDENLKRVGPFR